MSTLPPSKPSPDKNQHPLHAQQEVQTADPKSGSLSIQNSTFTIAGRKILDAITLDFRPGTLNVLLGPNGAGKSTLMAALAGDLADCRKDVSCHGKPISLWKAKHLARERAVMTQDHAVRFAFSVREVVSMGRLPHFPEPVLDRKIIDEALLSADVVHLEHRNVQTLSGGEASRTAFARVLAQTTPIVFLDEPTAALDLFHQEKLLKELKRLSKSGACVIAVLHDLNLAAAYADRVVMLSNGQVVGDGHPRDVFTRTRIESVYHQKVLVIEHPTRKVPLIVSDDD